MCLRRCAPDTAPACWNGATLPPQPASRQQAQASVLHSLTAASRRSLATACMQHGHSQQPPFGGSLPLEGVQQQLNPVAAWQPCTAVASTHSSVAVQYTAGSSLPLAAASLPASCSSRRMAAAYCLTERSSHLPAWAAAAMWWAADRTNGCMSVPRQQR